MRIRIGYDIAFECSSPTPMILMLSVHPSRLDDLTTPQEIIFDPPVPARTYADHFGLFQAMLTLALLPILTVVLSLLVPMSKSGRVQEQTV